MAKKRRIAAKRHHVTIRRPVRAADGGGGATITYTTVANVCAEVKPRAANSRLFGSEVLQEVTHEIAIRHRSDVLSGDQVVHDGRALEVVASVDPDGYTRDLVIGAKEIAP